MNVVEFYAEAHWGSRYGVVDEFHPTPHKGLDCGLFHGIVEVPALHDGTVAAVAPSASVGHYVTVARPDGRFDTYCHIVPGVAFGDVIRQGDGLGRQATTQAEGGTAWRGQHTHLCLSRTRDGWAVWGYVNLDPTPGVIAVLTTTAGSGSSSINNTEEDMPTRELVIQNGDPTGAVFYSVDRIQRYHVKNETQLADYVYYIGQQGQPATVLHVNDVTSFGAVVADPGASSVQAVDLSGVVEKLNALDTQATDYQAQLEALLKQPFTGTVTLAPKA